jgi:hypothetical protein
MTRRTSVNQYTGFEISCKTAGLGSKNAWALFKPRGYWVERSVIPSEFHAERRKWDSPRDSRGRPTLCSVQSLQ